MELVGDGASHVHHWGVGGGGGCVTPLTPPTPPYLHHHTHTTLQPLNQFDQRDPPALTAPPAGNLPACRCARSPFSRPPSERISLSLPLRLWRYDQRGRNPTDNSRTLLIPSPPWLLLLCNICLSLGGFGEGGGGGDANCLEYLSEYQ